MEYPVDYEYRTWERPPRKQLSEREQAQWLLHNPGVNWTEALDWAERLIFENPEPETPIWGNLWPDNVARMAKEIGFPSEEALIDAMLEMYGDPTKLERDNPVLAFRDEFALRPGVVLSPWTEAGRKAYREAKAASQTSE